MKTMPTPVRKRSGFAIGIVWFASEEDATEWAKRNPGFYNGGFLDGMPTGREPARDYTDPETGQKLYAVTY